MLFRRFSLIDLIPFQRKRAKKKKKRTIDLWCKVIVGALPAAVAGLLLDDFLDEHLYTPTVISIALIVYGIAFILIERTKKVKANEFRVNDVSELTYKDALTIGAFQILSLIPGTSRSGSTIIGGMLGGVSRVASAEFSFFMAIPIMLGASGLKILKFILEGATISTFEIALLFIGIVVSYIVSVIVIKFLMDFVKRHSFSVFGIYRIVLGAVLIGYFLFV